MQTPVHSAIVESAAALLPPELLAELHKEITPEEFDAFSVGPGLSIEQSDLEKLHTYLDFVRLGSRLEDSTSVPSPLPDPDSQSVPNIGGGDYMPWLEHYWHPSLSEDKGLTVTLGYINTLLTSLVPVVGESIGEGFNSILSTLTGDASVVLGQFRPCVARAQDYWGTWVIQKYQAGAKIEAYLNLGRVCHLLADAGTPAHVQNDPHLGWSYMEWLYKNAVIPAAEEVASLITDLTLDASQLPTPIKDLTTLQDDDYEDYICQRVLNHRRSIPPDLNVSGNSPIVYNPEWSLSEHFRRLAEHTRMYDSDDVDGKGEGHPYHWDHFYDSLSGMLPIDRDITGDLSDYACRGIGHDLVPLSIRFTAGLLCMFFRQVGVRFKMQLLSVRLKQFTVLEDTDPFGKGEIFLKAWIDGLEKLPFGEYDMGSGDTKRFKDVEFASEVTDPSAPMGVHLSCYDDDGNYFWDDSESLGRINLSVIPSELPKAGQTFEVDSTGGSGRFSAILFLRLIESSDSEETMDDLPTKYAKEKRFSDSSGDLKQSRFNLRKTPPVYLNVETFKVHRTADRRHPRPCGIWAKLPPEKRLELSFTPDELLRPVAGTNLLQRIIRDKFGVDSLEYGRACRVTRLTSDCACARDER